MREVRDVKTTDIWDKYQKGKDHHNRVHMYIDVEKEHAFYEGDQWRYAKTGGEEFPVLNFIKPVVKYKVSTIAQNLMSIVYTPFDADPATSELCIKLTKFAAYQWETLKMDYINWEVIKNACITGDHYVYFYDKTKRSGGLYNDGKVELGARLINKTNVYFSDEQERDINAQEWIILSERLPVKKIRETAKANGIPKDEIMSIVADDNLEDQLGQQSSDEVDSKDGKCTSLLFLALKGGVLSFCRSTRSVIYEPMKSVPLDMYPIVVMRWESKVGDCRGLSGVETMIPNQLEVNKTAARRALAVKRFSYPTVAYDETKIQNIDQLDTIGAKIAIHNIEGSGGINSILQYLQPSNISNNAAELQNEIMNTTQTLEGAGDAALGTVDPTKASGEAIKAARDQAAIPLNEQYASYKQYIEDVAAIWYRLWKAYSPEGLTVIYDDGGIISERIMLPQNIPSVKINVSPIDPYSRLSQETALGNLLSSQYITFEEYVSALGDDSSVPKAALEKILENRRVEEMNSALQKMQNGNDNQISSTGAEGVGLSQQAMYGV